MNVVPTDASPPGTARAPTSAALAGPTEAAAPSIVVALWGLGNGVLVIVLRAYAGSSVGLGLYGGAVGLVECYALAVLVSLRRRPGPGGHAFLQRSSWPAAVSAAGVGMMALAIAYWPWPAPVAFALLAVGVYLAIRSARPGHEEPPHDGGAALTAVPRRGAVAGPLDGASPGPRPVAGRDLAPALSSGGRRAASAAAGALGLAAGLVGTAVAARRRRRPGA